MKIKFLSPVSGLKEKHALYAQLIRKGRIKCGYVRFIESSFWTQGLLKTALLSTVSGLNELTQNGLYSFIHAGLQVLR